MGGKSSSSTATSTTQSTSTQQYDQRVGASEGALAVGQGGSATVSIDNTTPEAWDFASLVAAGMFDLARQSAGAAASAGARADALAASTVDFADRRSQSEAQNALDLMIKVGLPVVAAIIILPKVFK